MERKAKRPTGSTIDWQQRRQAIAAGVLPLYRDRPWPNVSIEDIADCLGIGYWQVYYAFDGQEDIYRAAVIRLVESISRKIASAPKAETTIHGTIRSHIRNDAEIVGSEDYEQLLFLRIRDESENAWLRAIYQTRISGPLIQALVGAVEQAGLSNDLPIILLHGTGERYLRKLETALALPKLLYARDVVATEFERVVNEVVKDVWSSTCTFEGLDRYHHAPHQRSAPHHHSASPSM